MGLDALYCLRIGFIEVSINDLFDFHSEWN